MSGREFTILYTHQKTKKAKTWQDGVLKFGIQGSKASLYDDNKSKLDSLHVKPDQLIIGEQLESDRYLILIEEERTNNSSVCDVTTLPQSNRNVAYSVTATCRQPCVENNQPAAQSKFSLKRRRTGFTAPRQVVKKHCDGSERNPEEHVPVSHTQQMVANPRTSLSSPLFSTPFQKKPRQDFMNLYTAGEASLGDENPSRTLQNEDRFENRNLTNPRNYRGASTSSRTTGVYDDGSDNPSFNQSERQRMCNTQSETSNIFVSETTCLKQHYKAMFSDNNDTSRSFPVGERSLLQEMPTETTTTKRNTAQILALLGGKTKATQDGAKVAGTETTKRESQGIPVHSTELTDNIRCGLHNSSHSTVNLINKPLFGSRIVSAQRDSKPTDAVNKVQEGYPSFYKQKNQRDVVPKDLRGCEMSGYSQNSGEVLSETNMNNAAVRKQENFEEADTSPENRQSTTVIKKLSESRQSKWNAKSIDNQTYGSCGYNPSTRDPDNPETSNAALGDNAFHRDKPTGLKWGDQQKGDMYKTAKQEEENQNEERTGINPNVSQKHMAIDEDEQHNDTTGNLEQELNEKHADFQGQVESQVMITQGIGDRDRPIGRQTTEVMGVLNCDTQDRAKDEDIAELDEMISIVINEENTSQASHNEQKNVNRYDSTANVSQPSSVDTFDISLSSQLSQGWGQSTEVQEMNVSGLQEVPVGDSLSPVLEVPRQFRFHHTQHQLEMKKSEAVSSESKKLGKVNILEDLEVSAVLSSSPLEQNEHRTGFDLHKLVESESQRDYTCELQKVKYDSEIHEPIHFTNHHSSNTHSQIFPLLERLETHKLFSDMHSPQKHSLHAHRKSSYYSPTFARSEVSRTTPCNVEDSSQIHRLDTDNPFLTQETITGFWQPQQMVGKSKASMQEFQSKPDNLTEKTDVWKFQSGGTYNPGTSMILSQLPHPSELTGMKEETSTSCIAKSLVEKASEKIEDSHWQRAVVSCTAVRNSKSSTIHPAIVETESVENGVPDNDIIDLQNQSILQEDEEMYFVDIRSVKDSYNELPSNPWRWQQASSIDDHSAGEIPLGEHILSPIQTVPAVQSSVNKSQCSLSPDVSSPLHHIVPEYASSQDTDEMDCFIIDATSNIRSDSSLNCHSSTHSSWSNKPKDPVVKQNLQPDLLICSSNDVINCRSSDTPSIRLQNTFSKVDYGKRNMFNQNTTSNMESTNMRNSLSEHTAVTGAVHHSQTDQQGGATSGVVRNRQYQFKRRERKPVISQPPEDEIRDSPQGGSSECSSSTNLSTSFNDRQNQSNALRRILARSTNLSSPGYDGRRDTRSSSPVAICSEDISSEQNAQCGTENVKNMYGNERHENQTRYQNASQDDVLCDRHDQESYTGRFSRSNQLTRRQGNTNRCKSTGGTESVGATRQYRTGLKRLSAHPVSAALSRHTLNNQNASHLSYGHKPSNAAVNRNYSKKGFNTPVLGAAQQSTLRNGERNLCGDLYFPSKKEVENEAVPVRQVTLPVSFSNVNAYKQTLIAALKEHLNIVLFDLSQRFHSGLAKADISQYIPNYESHKGKRQSGGSTANSGTPACEHGTASKMVMVKKDGPNKGRFFYTCSAPRGQQCKFFLWADVDSKSAGGVTRKAAQCVLSDAASIDSFFKSQNIALYSDCGLIRKSADNYGPLQNAPPWIKKYRNRNSENMKKKLYLQLTRKEHSSLYSKDDLWIISKDLNFDQANTFIAKSVFHGPSSSCEIEIEPVSGYSPSNWANSETVAVHAILAFNASNELSCISNIQDYLNPRVTPIVPYLVHSPEDIPSNHSTVSTQSTFRCPSSTRHDSKSIGLPCHTIEKCAEDYIQKYDLNVDQSTALRRVAKMVSGQETTVAPITLIHGVFGAGKSFLLAVTIIFLVELFNLIGYEDHNPDTNRWKILVSSTTNVAVDRILLGLLDLSFEDFVRVGSLKKIAKPVLPYSVHAAGSDSQELKGLQKMLRDDLTPSEKVYVRKSIEKHRLGHNKAKLSNVKVVGVTCAACDFPCMQKLKFPVVLLDECSQMTEPTSLLPMARFECEKLVLVGDPKQLNPTIQGSESAHQSGLEQTLFDRLTRMGHLATLLRTQYRCHPNISAVANNLFYGNQLMNGVSDDDRSPLADGFPTLCFFNVSNGKEMCGRDGSYFNDAEAEFVVFLIETLISYGVQPCNIGVITLYKAQLSRISLQIQASNISSQSELRSIQISTVDAFQGGEKGIIILSCVRTDYMGFIDCDKRTNVALTRSKNHLFIVGNMKMLYQNDLWGKVISHCQEYRDGIQSSQSFMRKWRERQVEMENQLSHESEQSKTKTAKRRNRSRKANVCDDDSESKTGTAAEEDSLPMSFDDSDLEDFDMVGLQSAKTKDRQLQRCSQQFKNAANENDALNDDPSPLNFDPDIHQCDDASAISGFNRNAAERSEIIDTDKNEAVIDSDSPSYSPLEDIQSDDSDEELPDFDVKG